MNYTELNLSPNSAYSARVCLDQTTEIGAIFKNPYNMKISWVITFRTDSESKIINIQDLSFGDNVRLEEYDFDEKSITLK